MFPFVHPCLFCHLPASVEEVVTEVSNGKMETEMGKAPCPWLFMNAKGQIPYNNLTERSQTGLGYFGVNREKFG